MNEQMNEWTNERKKVSNQGIDKYNPTLLACDDR
jgi:hypothetical protein